MRLIDADALIEEVWHSGLGSRQDCVNLIQEMPTIERPHGEWVEVPKYKGYYVCSNCLKRLDGNFERFEHWEMKKDNFCSVCGSDNRKRGDANENDGRRISRADEEPDI